MIRGFHSGDCEQNYFLGYSADYSVDIQPTFRRTHISSVLRTERGGKQDEGRSADLRRPTALRFSPRFVSRPKAKCRHVLQVSAHRRQRMNGEPGKGTVWPTGGATAAGVRMTGRDSRCTRTMRSAREACTAWPWPRSRTKEWLL
jgi:hypothetical protein